MIQAPPQRAGLLASRVWPVAVSAIGLSLWAQLFLMGALAEGHLVRPRPTAMVSYLLPVGVLLAGVAARAPLILLALFPVCALPGLLLLPEQEKLFLGEATSMVRLGATWALYLAVASAGSARDAGEPVEVEALADGGGHQGVHGEQARAIRRFVWARVGVLAVLFVLPAYAVFQDAEVGGALSRHYAGAPKSARTFLGLVHVFVWSVAAYMMALVPSLNLEYDHRRLRRRLTEQYRALSRARLAARAGVWVLLSVAVIALALVLA